MPDQRPKRPNGRPPFVPTDAQRQIVQVLRSVGLSPDDIAVQIKIDRKTLAKHFREELAHGKATILARMGAKVVQKALAGDGRMLVFYLRTHGGEEWKDKTRLEHTGADGGPLVPPSLVIEFVAPAPRDAER